MSGQNNGHIVLKVIYTANLQIYVRQGEYLTKIQNQEALFTYYYNFRRYFMKKVKRILAAVTAAALALLIAPELGGEVFSQVGELVQGIAVSVSAEEGEAAPVETEPAPIKTEPVQSETDIEADVTDNDGIVTQTDNIVDSGKCGDNATWTLDNDGVLTISGTGEMYDYSYSSNNIDYVSAPWYSYREFISSIFIENGVTSIGEYAFKDCSKFTNIIIPGSVTSIGGSAFSDCTSLASITIPSSITSIGYSAFFGCISLTNVMLPNSVTSIGKRAFYGCKNLTNITLPNDINCIRDSTFRYCINLKSIEIPSKVGDIFSAAFEGCTSLSNITFHSSVSCWDNAFRNCTSLTDISSPGSISFVGCYVFSGCTSLTSYSIPTSYSINRGTFEGCKNLASVEISEGVKRIEYAAFSGCEKLTNVIIPYSLIGISGYAFGGCTSLTSIVIPDNITVIDSTAFTGCTSLKEMDVSSKNAEYSSINEVLFNKNKTELLIFPGARDNYAIPDSVTSIGYFAFHNCLKLTHITIPDSVTLIDDTAFLYNNIEHIHIPSNKTYSDYAGQGYLPKESSYYFPGGCGDPDCPLGGENGTDISNKSGKCGDNAVWSLSDDGVLTISGSGDMYDYELYQADDSQRVPWYSEREKIKFIIIEDGITGIGASAFSECNAVKNIYFPSSVKKISNNALLNCTSLKTCIVANSEIEMSSSMLGYSSNTVSQNDKQLISGLTVYSHSKSAAEQYANQNNIAFEKIFFPDEHISFKGTVVEKKGSGMDSGLEYISYYFLELENDINYYNEFSNLVVMGAACEPVITTNIVGISKNLDISMPDYIGKTVLATGNLFTGAEEFIANESYGYDPVIGNCTISLADSEIDEDAAKEYKISANFIDIDKLKITYDENKGKYDKDKYTLTYVISQDYGEYKSIDGLNVEYRLSNGFSFSSDSSVQSINSTVKANPIYEIWEAYNEEISIYPYGDFNKEDVSITVLISEGNKIIKTTVKNIKINIIEYKEEPTSGTETDITGAVFINSQNIGEYKDQNGDLIIEDGSYAISGNISCNNLYVRGGKLCIESNSTLNVLGNVEVTGGKTNWFNPISTDEIGGVLSVDGTLNVGGNMLIGTDCGILNMTFSKNIIDVKGNVTVTTNSTEYNCRLSNGVLKIGGSFESSGKFSGNFKATDKHITHFYGSDPFSIKMNTKNKDDEKNSYFNNLTFTDSAVKNFNGDLYTFNVKGYFRQNDTKNPNYIKGELLDRLFKDHTTFGAAEEAVVGRFAALTGGTSALKTSIKSIAGKKIPKDYIDMICAYSEMYFQMEVMNNENDSIFDIEGAEIKIHGFKKEITFYDVPFGNTTAEFSVDFNVVGGGFASSTADLCSAQWTAFYDGGYISGLAPMTYISTDSLAADLRKFAEDEGHFNDFWYWMEEFVKGFVDDFGSFTKIDVKGTKCQIAFLDKCYKSLKKHDISPFKYTIKDGNDALKKAKKFADVVNKKSSWFSAILCPVDVEITDSLGNVVGSIVDNNVVVSTNKVTMTAIGDKKYCAFNENDNYSIKLTATGSGTMDYIVEGICENITYRRVSFNNLPLYPGTVYTGKMECINMLPYEDYKLIDNQGNIFLAESDIVDLNGSIEPLNVPVSPSDPTPSTPSTPSDNNNNNSNQGGNSSSPSVPSSGDFVSGTSTSDSFSVKVENKITGKTVKVTVKRSGEKVTVNLGKDNKGYYANIYAIDESLIDSVNIKSGNTKFNVPTGVDFYIVIDKEPHFEYEDVSSAAGIYELFEEKKDPFCMLIIVIAALGFLSASIASRCQKNKH